MSYGIRVSKPGSSATDPTTPLRDLAFSSEFISPKIAESHHFTSTGSIVHGYGYPPQFYVMCRVDSGFELTFVETIYPFSDVDAWFCLTNSIFQSTTLCTVTVDEEKVYCDDMGISDYVIVFLLKDATNE